MPIYQNPLQPCVRFVSEWRFYEECLSPLLRFFNQSSLRSRGYPCWCHTSESEQSVLTDSERCLTVRCQFPLKKQIEWQFGFISSNVLYIFEQHLQLKFLRESDKSFAQCERSYDTFYDTQKHACPSPAFSTMHSNLYHTHWLIKERDPSMQGLSVQSSYLLC